MEDRPYLSYAFRSPRMDQSVPTNQVKPGSFGRISGVDGRFSGGLRKYFGNRAVLDLDGVSGMGDIDAYNGPDFIQHVVFQKRETSTIYRGFVVRWDSQNDTTNEQIDLIYTSDNGTNWSRLAIWAAGNGITSTLGVDCVVDGAYLLVAVDTKDTMTVYWNGSALVSITSGPGSFSTELGAMTLSSSSADSSYWLRGSGKYQVAYRFYSSTRGIYSALSEPLTIQLDLTETAKSTGTVSFSSAGGDSGLLVDGDTVTINGRVYEADADDSYTGDVQVDISDLSTIAEHAQALADAINGDSSAVVSAQAQSTSVLLTSILQGSTGNTYTLSVSEVSPNTNDITVSGSTLIGGGVATDTPQSQCKAVIDFPSNTAVVSGKAYADFDALFDTVDVFRSIDLGDAEDGAILYLEQTIAKSGNWATSGTWDDLQVTIGTVIDEALPFYTMYDPEKDIVTAPPQSGSIGRYEEQTYMGQALSTNGGYDTLFSSAEHSSPEYFSTYNTRKGIPEDGRPLRFLAAGQSLFQLAYNSIVHIFKSGKLKPIQFTRLHSKRGITGKYAAHPAGNSVFMVSSLGLAVLNGEDGSMGGISAADRVIFDDWKDDLASVQSGYDSLMNASFFLNPTREEMIVVWHSTQVVTMMDGANFVAVTSGPDLAGTNDRAYFVTATGLIVSPDVLSDGSGTMWDLSSSYTLNGTATSTGANMVDENATFHADMVGAKLYMTTGDNAGIGRTIATVNTTTKTITFSAPFPYDISTGDTYAISPVPFSCRAWAMQVDGVSRFMRWVVAGVSVKAGGLSGFDDNPCNMWRVGAYRNRSATLESAVAYPSVESDPEDSAEVLNVHGIDVEPYIEQIASGVSFELTDAEFNLSVTDSRKDSA
jgi:hypothetical protein